MSKEDGARQVVGPCGKSERERGRGREERTNEDRSQDLPLWESTNHEAATPAIADLHCDFVVGII